MVDFTCLLITVLTSLLAIYASLSFAGADEERKVHIVYMGSLPRNQMYTTSSHHVSLLQKVVGESFQENLMVRSYKRSFNGFAAKLTRSEVEELSGMEDVVSVFPDWKYDLLTTRSWDFLGFSAETTSRRLQLESDIIVGVIDTGVWPELPSFSDEGFGPPPKKWKGACKGGVNFTCNNKLIGARCYDYIKSARDEIGHGSHTATTVAGVAVKDVSFYGLAKGTARGGVPSARIAAYKACDGFGCFTANILAAFDDAIADGVDILSVSVGFGGGALPLHIDPIAIGAFHAMDKGILTAHGAGNDGNHTYGLTSSTAPWLISVAASSMDRRLIDKAVLGNERTLLGLSVNSFCSNGTNFPLVDGNASVPVKGKIVVGPKDVSDAVDLGAAGIIYLIEKDRPDVSFVVPIPAVAVSNADYKAALSYLHSSKAPVGTILQSEAIEDPFAPIVASFSSRGPNAIFQEVMKPDVSAPGVDILAGYSPIGPTTNYPNSVDKRKAKYNFMSGTSMSCPHVAGVAAYVKSFHPDWSPSAIQSAIMTTATPMSATANLQGEFAYGSGHVNPIKAVHPGLVYEASKEDYMKLLCRTGFDKKKLRVITGDDCSCPTGTERDPVLDFNYPSLTARVVANKHFMLRFKRVVTNVGQADSVYKAMVSPNRNIIVKVEPKMLSFQSLKEKKSFNVTVSGRGFSSGLFKSAVLEWSDGKHCVKTPIVVHTIDAKPKSMF